jgi:hypothetical protein
LDDQRKHGKSTLNKNTHHLVKDWVPKTLSFQSVRQAASAGKTSRSPNLVFFPNFKRELAFGDSCLGFRVQVLNDFDFSPCFIYLVVTRECPDLLLGLSASGLGLPLCLSLLVFLASIRQRLDDCFQDLEFRF